VARLITAARQCCGESAVNMMSTAAQRRIRMTREF